MNEQTYLISRDWRVENLRSLGIHPGQVMMMQTSSCLFDAADLAGLQIDGSKRIWEE